MNGLEEMRSSIDFLKTMRDRYFLTGRVSRRLPPQILIGEYTELDKWGTYSL